MLVVFSAIFVVDTKIPLPYDFVAPLKYQLREGMKSLNYLMDHILY